MSGFMNIGIDLGTTNSCIAAKTAEGVRVFQNNEHALATPSAVWLKRSGRRLVGVRAKRAWIAEPQNTAIEFKRWMGQSDRLHFPAADIRLSAEELSAEVLKALLEDAQRLGGSRPSSAVVTVPAAFTQLQSGATQRAARLAGLESAPVLAEPVAAALAYGWSAATESERWLVFDLGGGTFDVAIVSTMGGRLVVVDHAGDNGLGGKEIDAAIAASVIEPQLSRAFRLPSGSDDPDRHERIRRTMVDAAERAKIELTHRESAVIEIESLGDDLDGRPIVLDLEMTRSDLERAAMPTIRSAIELAQRLLERAQRDVGGVDRIVLVGGPTQMPLLRDALSDAVRIPIDSSLDPMTAVAEGAAMYASTVPVGGPAKARPSEAATGTQVRLAYEPTSKSLTAEVDGRIEGAGVSEVRVEADGGFWNSGWLPLRDGMFSVTVHLEASTETRFWVHARDAQGRLMEVSGGEFSIRHGLEVASPPLPHDLFVEVLSPEGESTRVQVFPKGTPLPRRREMTFRAAHRVVPGDAKTDLPIKIFEAEQRDEQDGETPHVGVVFLRAEEVARPIPAGSEIAIEFRMDASRTLTVSSFVPHISQEFNGNWALPDASDLDFGGLSRGVPARLEEARGALGTIWDASRRDALEAQIAELHEQIRSRGASNIARDPDAARRLVEATNRIERSIRADMRGPKETLEQKAEREAERARTVITDLGEGDERKQLELLLRDQQRALRNKDRGGVERATQALINLKFDVLFRQPWFLKDVLEHFETRPADGWDRPREAQALLRDGRNKLENGDVDGLREVIFKLYGLVPASAAQIEQLAGLRSGLRRY